jgi:hypothetical protein
MDDPLPVGMNLRVPKPDVDRIQAAPIYPHYAGVGMAPQPQQNPEVPNSNLIVGSGGLCEFDQLSKQEVFVFSRICGCSKLIGFRCGQQSCS